MFLWTQMKSLQGSTALEVFERHLNRSKLMQGQHQSLHSSASGADPCSRQWKSWIWHKVMEVPEIFLPHIQYFEQVAHLSCYQQKEDIGDVFALFPSINEPFPVPMVLLYFLILTNISYSQSSLLTMPRVRIVFVPSLCLCFSWGPASRTSICSYSPYGRAHS